MPREWISYTSNQTGRTEVYVKPFPSGDGRWQVSTTGGVFSRWRGDGKEIFYLSAGTGGKVMAVTANAAGSTFEAGVPHELFDSGYVNLTHSGGNWHTYAVSPDGQRFLIPRPVANLQGDAMAAPITVILNWTAALKR